MKLKTILVIPGFFLLSCGIKGPPLPPLKQETIQDQKNGDEVEKTTQPVDPLPKGKKLPLKKKKSASGN